MRTSLIVVLSIVSVILGFIVGRSGAMRHDEEHSAALVAVQDEVRKVAEARDVLQKKIAAIEHDLTSIARVDIDEYLRLQDADVRAKKLAELLGQVFIVLLNHALLPQTPDKIAVVEKLSNTKYSDPNGSSVENGGTNTSDTAGATDTSSDEKSATTLGAGTAPAKSAQAWSQAEVEIGQVTLANADAFLAKTAISDLRAELKGGRPFRQDDPRLVQIQGLFSGNITFLDAKRAPMTMELETSATEVDGGKLKGSYSVRLFKDGERTGNTNSNGSLDGIMNTSGESSALIVKTSSDQFAQLYYIPGSDAFVGNLYEMTAANDSKLVARVKLTR